MGRWLCVATVYPIIDAILFNTSLAHCHNYSTPIQTLQYDVEYHSKIVHYVR